MTEPQRTGAPLETELRVDEQITLPVIEEVAQVSKREVETGVVRLHKTVSSETVVIDEAGFAERVNVEHVPVNRYVDSAPPIRYEGDTMIIPLVQEVVVVERRLILREEVRVTREAIPVHIPVEVELRREDIHVEREEHRNGVSGMEQVDGSAVGEEQNR